MQPEPNETTRRFVSTHDDGAGSPALRTTVGLAVFLASLGAGLALSLGLAAAFGGNSFVFIAACLLPVALFGGIWLSYRARQILFPDPVSFMLELGEAEACLRVPADDGGTRFDEHRFPVRGIADARVDDEIIDIPGPDEQRIRLPRRYTPYDGEPTDVVRAKTVPAERRHQAYRLDLVDGSLEMVHQAPAREAD